MEIKCQKYLQVLHFSFSPQWKISCLFFSLCSRWSTSAHTVHLCRLSCCSASAGVEPSQWATRSTPTTCTTRPSTSSNTSWSSPPLRMPRRTQTWGERQRYILSKANAKLILGWLWCPCAHSPCSTCGCTRWRGTSWRTTREPSRTSWQNLGRRRCEEIEYWDFMNLRCWDFNVCKPTFT